jgi:hypothetical protein
MNNLHHLIEDGSPSCPACTFCDEPINGPMKMYGSTPMHPECHEKLSVEMASLEDEPTECRHDRPRDLSEDDLDYAYQKHYGFGGHIPRIPRAGFAY